jgi:hypothetical protein
MTRRRALTPVTQKLQVRIIIQTQNLIRRGKLADFMLEGTAPGTRTVDLTTLTSVKNLGSLAASPQTPKAVMASVMRSIPTPAEAPSRADLALGLIVVSFT